MKKHLAVVVTCLAFGTWGCSSSSSGPSTVADMGSPDAGSDVEGDAVKETQRSDQVDNETSPDGVIWVPLADEPGEGYLARQQEYLQVCHDVSGPGGGGIYGQVCRVALGAGTYNEEALEASFTKIAAREDTSDFHISGLARMLHINLTTNALPDELLGKIEDTVLNFKYWLDEPGLDKMCYWTENHQILYHSNELLAGLYFPDTVFPNDGKTGLEHAAHARPLILRWLEFRARFGFSEWHSNVYFNEDMPALVNLVDFGQDEEIGAKAAMVLDIMGLDMASHYYKGRFATVKGRTYPNKFLGGLSDSTSEAAWLMLGLGEYQSETNFTGAFLASSQSYWPPAILEDYAQAVAQRHETRQRDGVNVGDGPQWGIGYESDEDVIFWTGMSANMAPEVINGTAMFLDKHDLWGGFLFGDVPEPYKSMLMQMAGTPELKQLAEELEVASRGIALEAMNTYTFRTPHFQLSGAQDYKPGYWSAQTQMWLATLSPEAFVFTSFAGKESNSELGLDFASEWVGGWQPRATFYRTVGVVQYRADPIPLLDEFMGSEYTHAFFPKAGFDEVLQTGNWVFGRKGDGWLGLTSLLPLFWAEDNEYELVAEGPENVWVIQMGSIEEHDSFDAFIADVSQAPLQFEEKTSYASPIEGEVVVGWDGPMLVDGVNVVLGPYARFENDQCHQEYGSLVVSVEQADTRLELNFESGQRLLWKWKQ